MGKEILLIKTEALLKQETIKKLHNDFVDQVKSGVVIIPAYFDARILNVPENIEVVIQSKNEELVLLNKPFHIKENNK